MKVQDHSHGMRLLKTLNKNRQSGHPSCDLRISNKSGSTFAVHKAVLVASSPYFDAMLSSNFAESRDIKVELPFSTAAISTILDYIYSGTITLSTDVVLELLHAADFLLMDNLKGPIVNFICADYRDAFSEKNVDQLGIDASVAVFNVLKYFVEDEEVLSYIGEVLMNLEEKSFDFETIDSDEISDPLMNKRSAVLPDVDRLPSGTNVYRVFSNKLFRFDGFGWSRVLCPEFNEKTPSLKNFAVVDENGRFLIQVQDELRLFEMEDSKAGERSPSDRSLKPFSESIISGQSSRLCFSENVIMSLLARPGDTEENLYTWNKSLDEFQLFGDIWPLKITYLDYLFEDSVQGKARIFVVGNYKTFSGETVANSIFCFNLCPLSGSLISHSAVQCLPFINNSYIYHHFNGRLIAIPRIFGRNFCKDFYYLEENTSSWCVWEEAKVKADNRTVLDVISTKEYLYFVMSKFNMRWQNELWQWNGQEFADVTFSTSMPIEGQLLERISWIDYNVLDKVLKKARRLWL